MHSPKLARLLCLLLLALPLSLLAQSGPDYLMPQPAQVTRGQGQLRIDSTFTVGLLQNPGQKLAPAATRFLKRLSRRTGLFLSQPVITGKDTHPQATLVLKVQQPGETKLGTDESYILQVTPRQIVLSAMTEHGAIYGLETLLQLLQADAQGYYFPVADVQDVPRFVWRGLMLDASRHFLPVHVVKRQLDAMAMMKLNVLHWHLSDDQGFRVETKSFPDLHLKGSDGFYYTQAQIKDVIAYADARGIRVVPEFDMPGHTTSWMLGAPQLASLDTTYSITRGWGVFDAAMDPTKESTYQFLEKFLKEMTALFPDAYFHIGGDENEGKQWKQNARIVAFMQQKGFKTTHELQAYFNRRLQPILQKNGKIMMGWDEILSPDLPKEIMIQSWRGKKGLVQAAKQGSQTILSNGYYIDLYQSAAFHYLNDPMPADSLLTPEQRKLVLGGEAPMWAEFVDETTIDARIWPRMAAIAERFWSPAHVNDVNDMYRRLEAINYQLEEVGLNHISHRHMLLRHLTANQPTQALETLANALEPLEGYRRHSNGKKYYSQSPLTRLVDAVHQDSWPARKFGLLVDSVVQQTQNGQLVFGKKSKKQPKNAQLVRLEQQLQAWVAQRDSIGQLAATSPILREAQPKAEQLREVGLIGLEALAQLQSGKPAKEEWVQSHVERLKKTRTPSAQVELVVVDPVEKLVKLAAEKR